MLSKVWRFPAVNLSELRASGKFRSCFDRSRRLCSSQPNHENASKHDYAVKFATIQNPGGSKRRSSFATIAASPSFFASRIDSSPSSSSNSSEDRASLSTKKSFLGPGFLVCGSILALLVYELNTDPVLAKEVDQDELAKKYGNFDKKFKTITIDELNQHNCKENRIWVSFREGVYDVTDFVDQHPGGNIILIAAGDLESSQWSKFNACQCHSSDPDLTRVSFSQEIDWIPSGTFTGTTKLSRCSTFLRRFVLQT